MKKVFVVLGLSRSGTSAVARSLQTLGINLGENLLEGDKRNPKGFWEDADVLYKVNRGVSGVLDHPWINDRQLNLAQLEANPKLNEYKTYALNLLNNRLQASDNWGFKDPRTTTILSFWQVVFQSANIEDHYVIVVRNPLATAYSNQQFAKLDLEIGLLLWLAHMISAIDGTMGKKRVIVFYENMLQDAKKELKRMHQALKLSTCLNDKAVDEYVNQFLDKDLRHYVASTEEMKAHPAVAVMPLCIQMYDMLTQLATDNLSFDNKEFNTMWQDIKAQFMLQYPVMNYLYNQHAQNYQLKKQIKTINKSLPWKLIYPLRKIDQIWRDYRRKIKEAERLS